jgi:hypothetical protein
MISEGMKFEEVQPHPDERYRVAMDDHSFVLSTTHQTKTIGTGYGDVDKAQKIWISKSMVEWMYKHRHLLKK